jgi:hypothetical protein
LRFNAIPSFNNCPIGVQVTQEPGRLWRNLSWRLEISNGISEYNTSASFYPQFYPAANGTVASLDEFFTYSSAGVRAQIPFYLAPNKFYYARIGYYDESVPNADVEFWATFVVNPDAAVFFPDCCIESDLCDEPGYRSCSILILIYHMFHFIAIMIVTQDTLTPLLSLFTADCLGVRPYSFAFCRADRAIIERWNRVKTQVCINGSSSALRDMERQGWDKAIQKSHVHTEHVERVALEALGVKVARRYHRTLPWRRVVYRPNVHPVAFCTAIKHPPADQEKVKRSKKSDKLRANR